jgi:hypothetical protein
MVLLEDRIREVLRNHYGESNTMLEMEYEHKFIQTLMEGEDETRSKWATYNQVILEYKHHMKDINKVKELQYRLTDVEDPKQVCMDVIDDTQFKSPELQRLYEKIKNFID